MARRHVLQTQEAVKELLVDGGQIRRVDADPPTAQAKAA